MKIIFSHGRSGQPDGKKTQRLSHLAKQFGHDTESVNDTDTQDPEIRSQRLHDNLMTHLNRHPEPVCLVGSSMGGYASLVAAEKIPQTRLKGVFLLAPALYLPRYQQRQFATLPCPVEIIHGWEDEVVLYEHSIRYAKDNPLCDLHLIHDNHRLSQQNDKVDAIFTLFLQKITS